MTAMEGLLVFPVIVAFMAVLVAGLLFEGRPLRGDLLDRFEGTARTIKGTIDPGTWFRQPRLTFDASGCPAVITWRRGRSNNELVSNLWLLVTVSGVPAAALKIWSKSRPWHPRLGRPWGCPAVVVGDPAIDGEFAIRSQPPSLAEQLFAPERRVRAAALMTALVGDDALSIRGGVLRASFEVDTVSSSGISALVSEIRTLTALLQELPR